LNIISICVTRGAHIEPVYLTKNVFYFPVAVNNSIKVGSLVFLLYLMFVTTKNITKRTVYLIHDVQAYHTNIYKFDLYVVCVRTLRYIYICLINSATLI
jgi:hypothetical protein